jgi:hypothetical protein
MVFFGDLPAEGARRASAAHGRSWAVACGFLGDTARLTWSQPALPVGTSPVTISPHRNVCLALPGGQFRATTHAHTYHAVTHQSVTLTHLCGGHKSKTHELRGSPQFETDEIPTSALWTEAKATSPEEGKESREVQFTRNKRYFTRQRRVTHDHSGSRKATGTA